MDYCNSIPTDPIRYGGLGINKNDKWREAHAVRSRIKTFSYNVKKINKAFGNTMNVYLPEKQKPSARELAWKYDKRIKKPSIERSHDRDISPTDYAITSREAIKNYALEKERIKLLYK